MNQTALDFDFTTPAAKPANKITFSRMENISNIPGDSGEQDILLDGMAIGHIVRIMEDTARSYTEWRVGEYDVDFFDAPGQGADEHIEASFTVNRREYTTGGYPTARKAHTAAKNWVRSTVAARIATLA